jgi:hypothetical protein
MILFLSKILDCEVLVTNHEPDLALICFATHASTEARKPIKITRVFDLLRSRVTMNNNRLVSYEGASSLIVSPDTSSFWVGGRTSKKCTENLECGQPTGLVLPVLHHHAQRWGQTKQQVHAFHRG